MSSPANLQQPLLGTNESALEPPQEALEPLKGIEFSVMDVNKEEFSGEFASIGIDYKIRKYIVILEEEKSKKSGIGHAFGKTLGKLSNLGSIMMGKKVAGRKRRMYVAIADRFMKVHMGKPMDVYEYIACIKDTYTEFMNALDEGADPNGKSMDGYTRWSPLCFTSRFGYIDMSAYLIIKGADVNYGKADEGATPLHFACANLRPRTVKLLLENGANPNVKDVDGVTPLMIASALGFRDIITMLTDAGAEDTEAQGTEGVTRSSRENSPLLPKTGGRKKTRKMYKKSKKSRRKYVR
jgi:hypothetical protein